jgi:hypothetical protein
MPEVGWDDIVLCFPGSRWLMRLNGDSLQESLMRNRMIQYVTVRVCNITCLLRKTQLALTGATPLFSRQQNRAERRDKMTIIRETEKGSCNCVNFRSTDKAMFWQQQPTHQALIPEWPS